MGIPGLMTYIKGNPEFFNAYELHGGYLVIDGHSLAAQLYISSQCNCSFGGDYDIYARTVAEFFDQLIKCEVVPLVMLDGGTEGKKLKTKLKRLADKLQSVMHYNPASQAKTKFMPLAMMMVFETVLWQKDVKRVRCIFEADPGIAGVAKVLNRPVLSFDSDFYIFDVMYIPINTLQPFVVKNTRGQGFVKRCKLFKLENLHKSFPGLDSSVLPLAAIVLGNDYVKNNIFKHFFTSLKLSNQNRKLYNERQRRIDATFKWLRNYNLSDAVAAVLSKLQKKHRQKVLDIIELVVNGYLILPCDMLLPLGFEERYEEEMRTRQQKRPFKFQGNIDTLESRQLWRGDRVVPSENSCSDEETKDDEIDLVVQNGEKNCNETIADTWPRWFSEQHAIADFPPYFVDMMCLRLFVTATQIEDLKYPSAYSMSLKIVEVIDGLLVAGRKEKVPGLLYVIRDGTNNVRRRLDEPVRGTRSTKFPAFCELRDTEMTIRKQIIDDTLEITGKEELFEDIPPEWRLYMGTILYWITKSAEPSRNLCHIHALLFTMLMGVVDGKIGYSRSLYTFNRTYGRTLIEIERRRKIPRYENAEAPEASIIEALKVVNMNDCLIAAPFFISNYTMDRQLVECPRKFNVTIVHAFSQFQSCLLHAIYLNALLGCPYKYPVVAELYNGTMLYNLYTNFEKQTDVETYVAVVLKKSPSLLNVFKLLSAKMKSIRDPIVEVDGNRTRGTRKRSIHTEDGETKTKKQKVDKKGN